MIRLNSVPMRRQHMTKAALLPAVLLLLAVGSAFGAVQYAITDLGTLGGTRSYAYDINNSGQVVGGSYLSGGGYHAFLYSGSGPMQDLGTLRQTSYGENSCAYGINDNGQVVGSSSTAFGGDYHHAFLYSGSGSMQDLGTLELLGYSSAYGINDSGQVVGEAGTTGGLYNHAFLYSGSGPMQDLGTLGGTYSRANDINDSGQVVGVARTRSNGPLCAFLYSGSGPMQDLGTLGGSYGSSVARAINNNGQVVGYSNDSSDSSHAFIWRDSSGMQDLGTLPAGSNPYYASRANSINNNAQVVGESYSVGGSHAFLYSGSGPMQDLNNLVVPSSGWTLKGANAINDKGQIVGSGTNPAGQTRAFLLSYTASTPTVQPRYDPPPPPPSEKKNLILYTHGWNTSEAEWSDPNGPWQKLDQALKAKVDTSDWSVTGWDWRSNDGNLLTTLNRAQEQGRMAGKLIAQGDYDHVHFIAHSAGSALISAAAAAVAEMSPGTSIQTTYLDPYAPDSHYRKLYGSHTTDRATDWSDNYIAQSATSPLTSPTLPNAHNVDVTWLDPNLEVNLLGQIASSHRWPIDFYIGTIPGASTYPLSGADDYGYPRSLEGGGWDTRIFYPLGDSPVILGGPGVQMAGTIERHDTPLDFSTLANVTSSTGTVAITGTDFSLTTGSPVWMSSLVVVAEPVNTLTFDAEFLSSGAEGLLAVYWDDQYVGQVDERYVLDGSQQYSFFLPDTFDPDAYSLAFRLDSYTDAQSNVVIGNVATGYTAVPEPSTFVLLSVGAISLLAYAWRRRKWAAQGIEGERETTPIVVCQVRRNQ